MKTAILISNTDGAQFKFRGELIKALRNNDWHVTSVSSKNSPEGSYQDCLKEISNDSYFLDFFRGGFLGYIKTYLHLRKLLKNSKFDIIHAYGHEAAIITILSCRPLHNKKLIITFTGLGRLYSIDANIFYRALKIFLNLFYRIFSKNVRYIFLNKEDKFQLILECNLKSDNVTLLNGEGFSFVAGSSDPSTIYKSANNINILFAGRLIKEKGIVELIEAMSYVRSDFTLLIAGVVDDDLGNLKIMKDAIDGNIKNIKFIGFLNNLPEILPQIDIVILPSKYREGLPRILIEALAYGKCIITSNAPGANATVINGLNGYILDKVTPDSIAKCINLIDNIFIGNAEEYSKELFFKKFDSKVIISEILTIYKKVNDINNI